jgi:ribonuclease VapC
VKRYLLDTSALLTLRDDEPGADRVADLLAQARRREAVWLGCFIGLMDGLYRVWKDEEEHAGRLPYEQCLALPIEWVHESRDLLEAAGALKATHSLSLADAWIAAAAELSTAILVHKDPEFAGCPPTRRRCRTGDLRARRRRSRAQRGCPAGIWLLTANGGGRTALSKAGRGPQMR